MDCDLLSVPLWAKAECGGWYPTRSNTSRYWWVLRGAEKTLPKFSDSPSPTHA